MQSSSVSTLSILGNEIGVFRILVQGSVPFFVCFANSGWWFRVQHHSSFAAQTHNPGSGLSSIPRLLRKLRMMVQGASPLLTCCASSERWLRGLQKFFQVFCVQTVESIHFVCLMIVVAVFVATRIEQHAIKNLRICTTRR